MTARKETKCTYENLLVAVTGVDCASVFQQPVTQRALAMVDVGNDAEVPVPLDGDGVDSLLELVRRQFWLYFQGRISPGMFRE
jgi:hypothetical protein